MPQPCDHMMERPANPDGVGPTRRVDRRRVRGWVLEIVETVGLTLVLFLGIQAFVARPYQVHQESMETTLLPTSTCSSTS
jgi:hypothetical protein